MKKKGIQEMNNRLNNPFGTQKGTMRISGTGRHKDKKDKVNKRVSSQSLTKGALRSFSFG